MAPNKALAAALLIAMLAYAAAQTAEPTPSKPATCTAAGDYRAPGGCKPCVSRSSPFTKAYGKVTCYQATTLSSKSVVCSNIVLPAFPLSNIDNSRIVRCINPRAGKVSIVFAVKTSAYKYVNKTSYIGKSLRLDGQIPRGGFGNGELVRTQPGITRLKFTFTDKFGVLRPKFGQTIKVTGVIRRQGTLLPVCFASYLQNDGKIG